MQRYPYVQKAQRRAYSADAHRVVELGRWSGVSKESFELNLHRDRYQQIGMIAHQFKVTDTKSAIIIQRERSRQAILKKVRKDSDERLEAAAAARKQQDEERKQRIAEKVRLREEQNAVEEEERRIKAMKDEKARAQAQARLDEQKQKDAPDRETRLAAAEKDEEELEKKKRMREEHRKQLEDKERDKRAKAQEAKKEAPKVADTTQAQPEVQEEEVTFVQDTPTVARISTEVKTFNFEEMVCPFILQKLVWLKGGCYFELFFCYFLFWGSGFFGAAKGRCYFQKKNHQKNHSAPDCRPSLTKRRSRKW